MKNKTVIQDYLFSSAMLFKTIAMLITLYALDVYAGMVFERNPVTRLLLQNDLAFLLAETAAFAFICFGYYRVRTRYLTTCETIRLKPAKWNDRIIRWSFNAVVAFVFLTYLYDAANDVIILVGTSLHVVQG